MNNSKNITRLVLDALLVGIFIICSTILSINLQFVQFSISSLPVILAVLLFDMYDGIVVATIGTFFEQLLGPYGISYNTITWMLPFMIMALVMGLLKEYAFKNKINLISLVIIVIVGEVFLTVLNTAALKIDSMIMGYPTKVFFVLLSGRLLATLFRAVSTGILSFLLYNPLKQVLKNIRK